MMRRVIYLFASVLFFLTTLVTPTLISANNTEPPVIVYFYIDGCEGCQEIESEGLLVDLENDGVNIIKYDLRYDESIEKMAAYSDFYNVPARHRFTPLIFAGEDYYYGATTILNSYQNGDLFASASTQLLDVPDNYIPLSGFSGLIRVIVAGLIDSVNPCAIAMLLMFISMVGVLKDRRILMTISLSYIGAIFITYFLIGVFLFTILQSNAALINQISTGLYIFFAILSLFLFVITFYDFYVTRKQDYGKVKNQLPKFIQSFNKRFMKRFTEVMDSEGHSRRKMLYAIIIPFFIGVVVAFTEAACTGQVYGLILISIRSVEPALGYTYLLIFNLLFILPLIIIASIAVYSRNIIGITNFIRERMPVIKFVTAMFFLVMVFYFVFELLDTSFIIFIRGLFIRE